MGTVGTDLPVSLSDRRDIESLYRQIQRSSPKLVGPDGESRSLPVSLYDFLVELISHLQAGKSVAIMQRDHILTTVEAARMLGVSRQFLVNLLESGKIPSHKVGTHRRIYSRDVLKYKTQRDTDRRRALNDLVTAELSEGLYDKVPMRPDDNARK
jgi:excisionase family DNA binding protein